MGCFPSKDQTENSQLVARLSERDAYASLSAILQRSENKSVLSVARSEASARWHSFPASHFSLRYGAVSQRGHYPEAPNKDNQDRWCVHVPYGGSSEQALFGVFDGHGDFGSQCAAFAAHAVRHCFVSPAHVVVIFALTCMLGIQLQCTSVQRMIPVDKHNLFVDKPESGAGPNLPI